MPEEYLSPEYRESLRQRAERHERHKEMLEQHKQDKAAARDQHKRDHGRGFVYPGGFY